MWQGVGRERAQRSSGMGVSSIGNAHRRQQPTLRVPSAKYGLSYEMRSKKIDCKIPECYNNRSRGCLDPTVAQSIMAERLSSNNGE